MNRKSQSQAFFTLGIAGLFLAGFFLLVTFGAATYRQAVEGQAANNRARALLGYISTCVRASDHAGGVEVQKGPVLVVRDRDSGYALRIYQWDGKLVEDYAQDGAPLSPEDAQVLGETAVFEIQQQGSLLTVSTDEGQAFLRLRSGGAG